MPGPPVVVCKGDKLVVDVMNHLAAEVTSFHFHGKCQARSFALLRFRILFLLGQWFSTFLSSRHTKHEKKMGGTLTPLFEKD